MVYELRHYKAHAGREAALRARFVEHTLPLFARHGFRVVGIWQEDEPDTGDIFYVLAWRNRAEKAAAWNAFREDPDWQRVKAESEKDGPLCESITSRMAVSLAAE